MNLDEIRNAIDDIDREIIQRLNKRVRLACEIGHIKLAEGKEIYVPSREEEVFGHLTAKSEGPLPEKAIRKIYREIISAAISLEKPLKIAYLGPEATYTHQAAMKNFGSSVGYLPIGSVPDVFTAVKRGDADYGVVPIENSTQGTVISSLDMLAEADLKIVAQIMLEISHSLISNSKLEDIKEVHSKDNALGQCRQWLARMLPGVELVESASTAAAVLYAKEHEGVAAIASSIAAELYDVPIISENVHDKEENYTRFLVIGKTPTPALGGGKDKTSLMFTVKDKPGALLRALQCFSFRGINLCKIESRPSRLRAWDYYFYVDVIGHAKDENVKEAIDELENLCSMVKWLGSYPNTGV
ncbi:MAG: prephenate dehydratase [Opitutales bacterium]|nr:prephenate dehydratase [Opitutales bacterium]